MLDTIRRLVDEQGRLSKAATAIGDDADLYAAGLTSFAAVQLMLALEETFDVEFPDHMLNRRSFSSISAIAGCLHELKGEEAA
ncbi:MULTISPECIES: acyl carrier protein [Methylosinus]|uniref:Acyl carrier protein n=1 Tax=Methylosinus sporium TaxID=428 RepID=A0A2U1SM69_METSR|nr:MULTISPECIES: acyl carrier protein [Methylosinus]MBU3887760.1 acyl carrier protein [Methylosinus sp. KRF6]PWB92712.1 acyl carrier protein [Methylosinus sporium]TRL30699.1 acyl carrier protein [Methylosinus sporium]